MQYIAADPGETGEDGQGATVLVEIQISVDGDCEWSSSLIRCLLFGQFRIEPGRLHDALARDANPFARAHDGDSRRSFEQA